MVNVGLMPYVLNLEPTPCSVFTVSSSIGRETSDITSFSQKKIKDDQVIRYEDRSALGATRIPTIPQCMQ
jgi:hypothetical protein